MGLWDKIKNIGSKIVKGVQSGISWVRDKAAPVIRKVWSYAKPAMDALIPGSKVVTDRIEDVASKAYKFIGGK